MSPLPKSIEKDVEVMENVYRNNFVKRTIQLMFAPKKIRKRPPEQWIKMPTDRGIRRKDA